MSRSPRPTQTIDTERVDVAQRVSIGLVAMSLAVLSLALGVAFLTSPSALLILPSSDVSSSPSSATAVTLEWTAPGDDGNVGSATNYDIRYSTSPITDDNFASAMVAADPPPPQSAGSTESFSIANLQPATTYFFALKSSDEVGNVSEISNVATKTTAALPQACVPTYSCGAWSSCVNGTQTRICTVTNACPPGLDAPITSQTCTVPPPPPPDPDPDPAPSGGDKDPTPTSPLMVASVAGPTIPVVRTIDPKTGRVLREFLAFSRADRNGVDVAVGDLTGDGIPEIVTGTGPGSDPLVKIFSDRGQFLAQFNPYPTSRGIGVSVATGDVDGNGVEEILTVPLRSASHVRIFRYRPSTRRVDVVAQAFAYESRHRNGFSIAAGDLDSDGRDEFFVAARRTGLTVTVMRLSSKRTIERVSKFAPFGRRFDTGMTLAAGDVDGNGRAEIIVTPGPGYWTDIKIMTMNGRTLSHFMPTSTNFRGGVDLTAFDMNGDGRDEVYTTTFTRGDPGVWVFRWNGLTKRFNRIKTFLAYPRTMQDGLRIEAVPHQ